MVARVLSKTDAVTEDVMARKKLRMYDYNRIIEGLRALESERGMARNGVASRNTIAAVREVAEKQGWLDLSQPFPTPGR